MTADDELRQFCHAIWTRLNEHACRLEALRILLERHRLIDRAEFEALAASLQEQFQAVYEQARAEATLQEKEALARKALAAFDGTPQ